MGLRETICQLGTAHVLHEHSGDQLSVGRYIHVSGGHCVRPPCPAYAAWDHGALLQVITVLASPSVGAGLSIVHMLSWSAGAASSRIGAPPTNTGEAAPPCTGNGILEHRADILQYGVGILKYCSGVLKY